MCGSVWHKHVPLQDANKISHFQSQERDVTYATETNFHYNYDLGAHTTQYKSLSTVVTKAWETLHKMQLTH